MKLFHKESKQKKETRSLPMGKKSRSAFAVYAALVLMLCCCTTTAFAASDPLTVINNLSDFIFGLIQTITGYAAWVFARQEDFAAQQAAYHHVGENPRRLVVRALRHASLAHAHCPDCRRSERL